MTPKEKAAELRDKFSNHALYWDCYNDEPVEEDHAKACALIAAEEARQEAYSADQVTGKNREQFWYDVIQELEAL